MDHKIHNLVNTAYNVFMNNTNQDQYLYEAQNFRGTFNSFSLEDFILFKSELKKRFTTNLQENRQLDFDKFISNLESNFYNWSRFFGSEAGLHNFIFKNGVFIILFILLVFVFIYKIKNNIDFTPSYLELFIIILVFSLVLFIYHRCADYHSACNIFGWSGSAMFAGLLCLLIIVHFFMLYKKVQDKKKKNIIKHI